MLGVCVLIPSASPGPLDPYVQCHPTAGQSLLRKGGQGQGQGQADGTSRSPGGVGAGVEP